MREDLKTLLRQMMLIRRFEEKVMDVFTESNTGEIYGTAHLYIGQEAVAVGCCSTLTMKDYITSTHRGHGHFIAKGGELKRIMAELYGKVTGYSKGRGGTQHMGDRTIGHLGSNGITGGGIPLATGAALAIKMKKESRIVISFFGDGAVNGAYFSESLNMAAIWKLPVIYVLENNLYAMSTPVSKAFLTQELYKRAEALGVNAMIVDGMDVLAMRNATLKAKERIMEGKGPVMIEAKTYRFCGHSKSDRRVYRTKEEERRWQKMCPISRLKARLIREGAMTEDEYGNLVKLVEKEIEKAMVFAKNSCFPRLEEALSSPFYRDGGK